MRLLSPEDAGGLTRVENPDEHNKLDKQNIHVSWQAAGKSELGSWSVVSCPWSVVREEMERWVLSWGVPATVARPRALADRIRQTAAVLSQRYE
jgi:hypothetical protein